MPGTVANLDLHFSMLQYQSTLYIEQGKNRAAYLKCNRTSILRFSTMSGNMTEMAMVSPSSNSSLDPCACLDVFS